MLLTIDLLRTFVAVVDMGSVVGASRSCGYSPAAISRRMASLQKRLEVQLFVPSGRGIRPTDVAIRLAEEARPLLDHSAAFNSRVHDVLDGARRA